MSKKQWVIVFSLAVAAGLILCVNGVVLYYYLNSNQAEVAAAPTTPAPSPTDTPTPHPTLTLPSGENTAVPTPVPTRVVTATPEDKEDNSSLEDLGEYLAEHTAPTRSPGSEAAPAAGSASIAFKANPTSITAGSCSTLTWHVEGVQAYWVDGQPGAGPTGSRSVCPDSTQTYELKYQMMAGKNLLKTYYQRVTVYVNEPASSSQSSSSGGSGGSSGSGSSSADAAYKAAVCEGLERDLSQAQRDNDMVTFIRIQDEMDVWQCDGDPNFVPTVCDLLALYRRWAAANRDAIRVMELDEEMALEGCQ